MTKLSPKQVMKLYGITVAQQKAKYKWASICPDCGHLRRTNRTKKSLMIFARADGLHMHCHDGNSRKGSECSLVHTIHPWERQVPMVETHAYLESQKAEAWEYEYDSDWRSGFAGRI